MTDKPEIPAAANDATLTIQKNGETVGTFSADATDNSTVNITVPTQTSQLENNSGYITMAELQQILDAMNHRIDSLENLLNGVEPAPDTVDGEACPGHPTVTDVDGNTYNTVMLGNKCWMKENLRTTKFADGTPIALIMSADTSSTVAYRYCPDNNPDNVATYGYLYNWPAFIHN